MFVVLIEIVCHAATTILSLKDRSFAGGANIYLTNFMLIYQQRNLTFTRGPDYLAEDSSYMHITK